MVAIMADPNLFDSDSNSNSSFYGFCHEEIEEPERRTENRKINFNVENSLDLSVDEYSSSDTETDSKSSDNETDNNVLTPKVVTMKLTTMSTCMFLIDKGGVQS